MALSPEGEAKLEQIQLEILAKRTEILYYGPSASFVNEWNSIIDKAIMNALRIEDADFFATMYIRAEDLTDS